MNFWKNKKGMTLIELLIAISLFSVVSMVASRVLIDVVQLEKKSSIQNAFYQDARIILQQITNEIQKGTIDYEEYFNKNVLNSKYYGTNYGAYASRFYDPGKSLTPGETKNPTNLGIECSYPDNLAPEDINDCEVLYSLSIDLNTGQNPFKDGSMNANDSNALCDVNSSCTNEDSLVDELYLIDSTGTKKTILARKLTSGDNYAIGIIRLEGMDLDQNGIIDTFRCTDDFQCGLWDENNTDSDWKTILNRSFITGLVVANNKIRLPSDDDLNQEFMQNPSKTEFIPITPLKSNIIDLSFAIHPLEDPYRAFAEPDMQSHPSVTVTITIGLSDEVAANYPGEFKPITLQTTVAAGVIGKINSYPPSNDLTWLGDLIGGSSSMTITP